jgi:hypothetical protein
MPAPSEEKPYVRVPGRSLPANPHDPPQDKHDRSLQRQHDPMPDWGRESENRLAAKRRANGPQGIF